MRASVVRKLKLKRYLARKSLRLLIKKRRKIWRYYKKRKLDTMVLTSNLISLLKVKSFGIKSSINKERINIEIPKIFSFIENPDETISIFRKLFYLGTHDEVNGLYIDHSKCQKLDICASTVMDVILIELKRSNKMLNKKFILSGKIPASGKICDIIEVSGIIKHLGLQTKDRDYIEKLDLIKCSKTMLSNSGDVATKVIDYFLKCLSTQNFTLDKEGKQILSEMIGEVIDNCENHGGKYAQWYSLGHYQIITDEKYGECQLVIFNFGNTIYESLMLSISEDIIRSLRSLTQKHQGFFRACTWTEEALWTLYALQDGVSRFRHKETDPDRGTGTVKLIESFQNIGKTADGQYLPLMSITSGNIHIFFNEKYKLSYESIGSEKRQIIAFNQENDLNIIM